MSAVQYTARRRYCPRSGAGRGTPRSATPGGGEATPPGSSSAPSDVPNALRAAAPCLQGGCGASKHGSQRGRPAPPPPAGGTPSPNSRRGGIAVIDASDCWHRAVNVPARVGGYHALHGERLPSGVLRGRRPSSRERLPSGAPRSNGHLTPNGITHAGGNHRVGAALTPARLRSPPLSQFRGRFITQDRARFSAPRLGAMRL